MNKRVAVSVAALLFAASVHTGFSQGPGVGARVGPTFSTFGGDAESGSKTGFIVSGYFIYSISERVSVYPELSYVRKGGTSSGRVLSQDPVRGFFIEETSERTTGLDYLELQVPITMMIPARRTAVSARLYAGPSVAVELKCRTELNLTARTFSPTGPTLDVTSTTESGSCESESQTGGPLFTSTKRLDFGLVLGAGMDVGIGRGAITGDLRYDFGLADIQDGTGGSIKNRAFEILLGYAHYFSR
ncbi:MAG: outer membrane beta-barrel protein [Gemmatimonadales bacterium]|nr:outer membrane beta-barrel protein [Gemmatimonadales bacterium]NIS65951.1 outer membrane beta-barrel protein [Gemmatimonadales bacterium]